MTTPDKDGWIEHDGKGMPVDADTWVLCKFRDGEDELSMGRTPAKAVYWHDNDALCSNWVHGVSQCGAEIVAYRVVTP